MLAYSREGEQSPGAGEAGADQDSACKHPLIVLVELAVLTFVCFFEVCLFG